MGVNKSKPDNFKEYRDILIHRGFRSSITRLYQFNILRLKLTNNLYINVVYLKNRETYLIYWGCNLIPNLNYAVSENKYNRIMPFLDDIIMEKKKRDKKVVKYLRFYFPEELVQNIICKYLLFLLIK